MKLKIVTISFLITCLFIVSCSKSNKNQNINNLNNNQIYIIGHAGSGFLSIKNFQPPNSFSSIQKALKNGAIGIEVDVQLSKDSIPILFHDLKLDKLTSLKGCVSDYNAKELIKTPYHCGFFYDVFQSEKIISLTQLLNKLLSLAETPEIHLDMKDYNPCMGKNRILGNVYAKAISEVVEKTNYPLSKISFIAMNVTILTELKTINNNYNLYLEETLNFDEGLKKVIDLNFKGITIKPQLLTKENAAKAHLKNKYVITFGGSSSSSILKLINANPDFIQVNDVDVAVNLLN